MMIPASPVGSVSPSRSRWCGVGVGLASSLGLALTLGLGPAALASGPCEDSHGAAAPWAVPHLSASLAQDICHMATMPTATRSEGERFLEQIQPGSLLTDTSASAETMTLPSLWWTRDSLPSQVGRHRLVDAWFSYAIQGADVRVVDVMINSQFWRALTMHQRYGVLAQFGNTTREFGYHLRFFQSNGYSARMIGLYACESRPSAATDSSAAAVAQCLITVDTPQIVEIQRAMEVPAIQTATETEVTPITPSAINPSPAIPQAALPPTMSDVPMQP